MRRILQLIAVEDSNTTCISCVCVLEGMCVQKTECYCDRSRSRCIEDLTIRGYYFVLVFRIVGVDGGARKMKLLSFGRS